jgi:hypothetical protein
MSRHLVASIAAALAVVAAASGSELRAASEPTGLVVRVGFMMGSRGDAPLPVATRPAGENNVFDDWDPTADNEELMSLLGLRQLVELARAMVTTASDNRSFSLAIVADKRHYELLATVNGMRDDNVFLDITLKEDGREVSRPRLGLRLGQKGVACARVQRGRDEAFVFFVLQVDRQ